MKNLEIFFFRRTTPLRINMVFIGPNMAASQLPWIF